MQNYQKTDVPAEKVVFATQIEDVIGGVTLATSGFVEGDIIPTGSPLAKAGNGLHNVVITAKVVTLASNSATDYQVAKGHLFKQGKVVASAVGAKAYTITGIDTTNAAYDVITLNTTLGVSVPVGAVLFEAAAESASTTSALKFTPYCLSGHTVEVKTGNNHLVDAWIRSSVYAVNAPGASAEIKAAMPHTLWL